ncbi:MAG: hypothetical protein IJG15_03935 [Lachnospiraceae bacterium]|nr:hypothetical protein [Lachnospiraceae bacterium]
MDRYFYIYNLEQSLYFLNCGLVCVEIGVGKFGHVYHKFLRDDAAESVFAKWRNRD